STGKNLMDELVGRPQNARLGPARAVVLVDPHLRRLVVLSPGPALQHADEETIAGERDVESEARLLDSSGVRHDLLERPERSRPAIEPDGALELIGRRALRADR